MAWIIDPECGVMEDDGNPGGDRQVGKSPSIRFVNPDRPNARITVHAWPDAPEWSSTDATAPECPHEAVILERLSANVARFAPMPDEHLACTHDLSALGVATMTELAVVDADGEVTWSREQYDPCLDTAPLGGDVAKAEAVALSWIQSLDPGRDLTWDGEEF